MEDKLPVLAIETSDELCSVAVMIDNSNYFESSIRKKHVHSEKLISLVEQVLDSAELKLSDIKTIAVSEGPGSFTGLRIGMAAAKGMAIAQGCNFISVPTIEAMALQISAFSAENQVFAVANNVNRDEVYFAKFKVLTEGYEIVTELKIIDQDDVASELNESEIVYGSYTGKNKELKFSAPDAKYIALWAFINGSELITKEYDYIEPNYLKNFVVRRK